jgi:hypothetical protein
VRLQSLCSFRKTLRSRTAVLGWRPRSKLARLSIVRLHVPPWSTPVAKTLPANGWLSANPPQDGSSVSATVFPRLARDALTSRDRFRSTRPFHGADGARLRVLLLTFQSQLFAGREALQLLSLPFDAAACTCALLLPTQQQPCVFSSIFLAFGALASFRGSLNRSECASSDEAVGSSACSRKGLFDPTGRCRTTPGFAIVAAMTSVSYGLLGETLVEEIAARAPRLKRCLHGRRSDSKIEKALRCLINFQFFRHAKSMCCGSAWFRTDSFCAT